MTYCTNIDIPTYPTLKHIGVSVHWGTSAIARDLLHQHRHTNVCIGHVGLWIRVTWQFTILNQSTKTQVKFPHPKVSYPETHRSLCALRHLSDSSWPNAPTSTYQRMYWARRVMNQSHMTIHNTQPNNKKITYSNHTRKHSIGVSVHWSTSAIACDLLYRHRHTNVCIGHVG